MALSILVLNVMYMMEWHERTYLNNFVELFVEDSGLYVNAVLRDLSN